MKNIEIKKVAKENTLQLQKISETTFCEAFSTQNTEEDMQLYLKNVFSIKKLAEELHDENVAFYFAISDNNVIGYLKLNFGTSQTEKIKEHTSLEIERIYVLSAFQSQNIGQLLLNKAIETAKQKNINCVWLGVWEKNIRAIRFYEKNGFLFFDKHIFKLGNDEQIDLMMKLNLKD